VVPIAGMSGNEIFCLAQKGLGPGEIVVGNSVYSMGLAGAIGSFGRSVAGGEITQITSMINEGRHAAIARMEEEAKGDGAIGVTGVASRLGRMAGFTEFLAQGTGVHSLVPGADAAPTLAPLTTIARSEAPSPDPHRPADSFFSAAASGIGLWSQLDLGYRPVRFALGNVAYALGLGRGIVGSFRTLARGEVKEFSAMYNEIRHTALRRLMDDASRQGANAVVDLRLQMLPYGPGTVELLLTGTASHQPRLPQGQVVTSELTGEELWNLAALGYAPRQLVMATSVYSLGVAAGLGALVKGVKRGELPEVTQMVYEARENCVELLRSEAEAIGAERVVSTRLTIREIGQGMVELVAVGTAVRRAPPELEAETETLIPQAVISDRRSTDDGESVTTLANQQVAFRAALGRRTSNATGIAIVLVFVLVSLCIGCGIAFAAIFGD